MIAAQRALVEQLLALAGDDSPLAGLTADEVGGRDEGLCELADPTPLGELLDRSWNARAATS